MNNKEAQDLIDFAETILELRLTEYQKELFAQVMNQDVQIVRHRRYGYTTFMNIVKKYFKYKETYESN